MIARRMGPQAFRVAVVAVVILGALSLGRADSGGTRSFSFDERIDAARAIERVYWTHRLWPSVNPGPKPPLEKVLSDATLRARVEDALRKSNAVATLWGRPITHLELQAEMDRMARETKDAGMLRELSAALGDDPFLIAETLARPVLVDRLARRWYASDERIHETLHKKAEAAMAAVRKAADLRTAGERYHEVVWTTRDDDPSARMSSVGLRSRAFVGNDDLIAVRDSLRSEFGLGDDGAPLPVGRVGALHENDTSFYAITILEDATDSLTVATASWPKLSFDAWWANNRLAQSAVVDVGVEAYTAPRPQAVDSYCTNDTWTSTSPAVPGARKLSQVVWTGSEMIVWSGTFTSDQTGGRYNPATDSWTPTSLVGAPPARYGVDAVWTGTEMLFWGGGGNYEATGGRYNPVTDLWTATTMVGAPAGRQVHSSVWTGSELIVWGGYNAASDLATGGRYNPSTDSWVATATGGTTPQARSYHRAVWSPTSGVMIVWGGGSFSQSGDFTTGGRYSPGTNTWATTSTVGAPQARQNFTAVYATTTNEMIVWGGRNLPATAINTGGRYNPASDTWVATSTVGAPSPRQRHTAVWDGTEMIAWGGEGNTFTSSSFGGRYNPSTDSWIATTTAGAPPPRRLHNAVWTGTEMIVWGGDNAVNSLNSGGRYKPATDSWVPTSTATTSGSPPSGLYGFSTVWTGTEMWIWGGYDTVNVRWDGAAFVPATAAWNYFDSGQWGVSYANHSAVWTGTQMLVFGGFDGEYWNSLWYFDPTTVGWGLIGTGPIAAREKHTAVWTGTGMLVWGGENGATAFNDGAIYTPSNGTWQVVAATTLAGRYEHTAIWTGTEMWVWGGHDLASNVYGDGGRYDPAANTWGSFGHGAGPAARFQHSAVWTGTEMIVWGGNDGALDLNTGGQYPSPETGAGWLATSTPSAPSSRAQHTAVWNGGQMIVWGGKRSATALGDGERFNPVSNSWQRVTDLAAPTPRYAHAAVWAGAAGGKMVVWGGIGTNTQVGGLYCSCATSLSGAEGAGGLTWAANKQTLSWGPLNAASVFNVYRGTVQSSWAYNHTCLSGPIGATSFSDAATPSPSFFFYYLVSGRNGCGESTLGNDSFGTPRPVPSPCP
jgi:hypothetical protein